MILPRHKSFTRACSLSPICLGEKEPLLHHASPIRNVKQFDIIFSPCHSGAQSNKGKHQALHATDRTVTLEAVVLPTTAISNHCSCSEFSWSRKAPKGPQSPRSLFKSVSKAARNRCPSAAAAEITPVKLVAGNKRFPQNSFISNFLDTYYHDREK